MRFENMKIEKRRELRKAFNEPTCVKRRFTQDQSKMTIQSGERIC